MKLPLPFYRLPFRFDVERLRTEIEQFEAADWQRHPTGFEGNSAIRLITVEGTENDDFVGPMRPTPHLGRCPYVRQVLAHFGVVWSRSRLMRLAPGASVPAHSDVNYHWFYRVRVHIPIVTHPAVRFSCGGQSVHMGAGEAWIFDNWREHSVHNGSAQERIHLVADTVGNAAFWALVGRSPVRDIADQPPPLETVPFRPAADPPLHFEAGSLGTVMPPAEIEYLSADLLGDLQKPADTASRAAVERFVRLVLTFCREWRALWARFGEAREGWPQFQRLREWAISELRQQSPLARVASIGLPAAEVFYPRVLLYAFHSPESAAPQDVDRTLSKETGSLSSPVRSPEKRTAEFHRPLFIVSAPRAGSTLLFETLAQVAGLYSLGGEAHWLVEGLPQLRPWAPGIGSNRLTAQHVDAAVRAHIESELRAKLRDRNGAPPIDGKPLRFLEKTPKNALRIPFFNALFPDACFVLLWRDPRENISSIIEAWRSGGWVMYPQLPGWEGPWSMLLPPGWEALRGAPLQEIAAFQWRRTNEIALEDLSELPAERKMALSYAEFLADPSAAVRRICAFAGLDMDEQLHAYLQRPLPLSKHTLTPPAPDKWRSNEALIAPLLDRLAPLVDRLSQFTSVSNHPAPGKISNSL